MFEAEIVVLAEAVMVVVGSVAEAALGLRRRFEDEQGHLVIVVRDWSHSGFLAFASVAQHFVAE